MPLHTWSQQALALIVLLCSLLNVNSYHDATPLWPKPIEHLTTGRLLRFHHKFSIRAGERESDLLRTAFKRYRHAIRKHSYPIVADCSAHSGQVASSQICSLTENKFKTIEEVIVNVASSDQSLGLQTNEAYSLNVSSPTTRIHAKTVFGALRALETLSQLSYAIDFESSCRETSFADIFRKASARLLTVFNRKEEIGRLRSPINLCHNSHCRHHHHRQHHHHRCRKHKQKQTIIINETNVYDRPRFPHRGLLIDTARHFLPKHIIKAQLDAMAMAKLNVLHWHIVDDQSFPYSAKGIYKLSEKGAFSDMAVYTSNDVQEIVSYGKFLSFEFEIKNNTYPYTLPPRHPHPLTKFLPCFYTYILMQVGTGVSA